MFVDPHVLCTEADAFDDASEHADPLDNDNAQLLHDVSALGAGQ